MRHFLQDCIRRLSLASVASALAAAVLLMQAAAASGRQTQTFDELAASADVDLIQSLEQVWEQASAVGANCQTKNEFEARDCARDGREARKVLNQGLLKLKIEGEQLTLGRYDFAKKTFPVSLRGQLASHEGKATDSEVDQSNSDSDDECPEVQMQETTHENELVLSTGGPWAWQGTLRISDEEQARALREDQSQLQGEVILRLAGAEERSIEDKMPALKKRAVLAKLSGYLHGNYPAVLKERARAKQRCWLRMRSAWRQVVVKAKVIGLRLQTASDADYVLSFPPSLPKGIVKKPGPERATVAHGEVGKADAYESTPGAAAWSKVAPSKQNKAPSAAETTAVQVSASSEASKSELAVRAPVVPSSAVPPAIATPASDAPVRGWFGLAFGASHAELTQRFVMIKSLPQLPFKDPTPTKLVETYEVPNPSPDIHKVLFRLYQNKLFYILIVYNNEYLHIQDITEAAARLASPLGPANGGQPVVRPLQRRVEQLHWQRDGVEAQLSLYPNPDVAPPRIELHLVDSALETEAMHAD